MSLVGETTFSKIGDLYCKCEWPPVEEGEMFLTLIHSDSAWTAILDKNSLDFGPRAADYEQDLIKTLKEAFSGESENYSIELNEEKLVWKKIQGKVKVKLAEIRLSRTSYSDAQTSFFTQLITENRILKKSNSELKIKEETLEKDNQLSHQMLVEFEKEKSEIENKMYARFLPILNEKKAYISELLSKENPGGNELEEDENAKRSRRDFSSSDEEDSM